MTGPKPGQWIAEPRFHLLKFVSKEVVATVACTAIYIVRPARLNAQEMTAERVVILAESTTVTFYPSLARCRPFKPFLEGGR